MKEFVCGTLVPECGAVLESDSEEQLLRQIATHARDEHGMDEVPPEILDKIRDAIVER